MRHPRPRGTPFLFVLLLLFASCAPTQPSSDTDALDTLVRQGAQYVSGKDSRGLKLMASAACSSPSYLFDLGRLERLWATYTISVGIESVRVLEVGAGEAKVEVAQTIRKVSGPDFQDTRAKHVYTFVKEDGAWKLCGNQVVESQPLR